MDNDLRIWLLGGFRAEVAGRAVPDTAWRRGSARSVVKLLALAPTQRLHREQLIDQLWPDRNADLAAVNLRKAVHFARQALGPDRITAHNGSLSLGDPLWVDVDELEAAARERLLAPAVSLYGGDLLPDDLFEPWTEPRREQLQLLHARVLLDWALELEHAGQERSALAAVERLAALDPLNEQAHVLLARLHLQDGRQHLAARCYARLDTALRTELGVGPSAATRATYAELVARFEDYPSSERAAVPEQRATALAPDEHRLATVVSVSGTPAAADQAAAILRTWGGTVLGDETGSTVAVFGLPRVLEDHAQRALRAAGDAVAQTPDPLRIGVATGEISLDPGAAVAAERVTGAAVAVAHRLRATAAAGSVLVHDRTCRASAGAFDFSPVRRMRPPAGDQPLVVRQLLAERADVDRSRRPGVAMVGRDAELAAVLSLADDVAQSRRPRLVVVHGPAGIGKSRLVREAVDAVVARVPTATVLVGRCRSTGQSATYWALAEWVRQACRIALDDAARVAAEKLRVEVANLLQPLQLPQHDVEATIFALATTAAIAIPESPLDRAEPKHVADELARAWPRFATACSAREMTVLVVEDLHWAETPLPDVLERIAARSLGPLLVLCTARAEFVESHAGFGATGGHLSTVALRPLTETASTQLVSALTAGTPVPEARRHEILATAEGNPFFLEQLVAHVAEGAPESLPDTVLSVLAARVDALPDAERRVLQQAAVVGRVFWSGSVNRALDGLDVAGALQSLERRGLVLTRPTSSFAGDDELAFAHALVRDVAYGSLAPSRRTDAHARVGEWLAERAADRHDELAELLAHHFAAAVHFATEASDCDAARREHLRRSAFEHLLVAGTAARRRFSVSRAVELHEQALEMSVGDAERLRAFEEIGDDQESAFHGHEAHDAYVAAIATARARPDLDATRARLCRKLASLLATTPGAFRVAPPDPADVDELVAEGLAAAGDDEVSRARLLVVWGATARLWGGSEPFGVHGAGFGPDPVAIEERIEAVEGALTLGTRRELPELIEAASSALLTLYGVAGNYGGMLTQVRARLAAVDSAPSRLAQSDIYRTAAVLTIELEGQLAAGLELARSAYELARDTNPHQVMHTTYPLLVALFHLDRWDELLPVLDAHVEAMREDPATFCQFVRDGPVIGASVLTLRGESDRARAIAALVPDARAEPDIATAWQSRLAVLSGDPATAVELSRPKALEGRAYGPQHAFAVVEALTAIEDWAALGDFLPVARAAVVGNALLAPCCDRAEGLAELAAGRGDCAREQLARALAGFTRLGAAVEAARTTDLLGRFAR